MSMAGSPVDSVYGDYVTDNYESAECSPVAAGMPDLAFQHMFDQQFRDFSHFVTVKNTFIDGWVEGEEEQPRVVTAKSCPMPKLNLHEEETDASPKLACLLGRLPADASVKARQLAAQYLPTPSPDAMPAYVCPDRVASEMRPMESLVADLRPGGHCTAAPEPEPTPSQQ